MRRYLRIYRTFFLSSLVRELEFRANFVAKVFQNAMWAAFFLLILLVIYGNVKDIAGWGRGESFILAGAVFLIDAVMRGLFWSLLEVPEAVRSGTLDFVVTKPVDAQFWISTRKFAFEQLGVLLAGIGTVAVGVSQAGLRPDALDWAGFGMTILSAIAIFYGFNLMLMTLAIWLVRVDNLWVLSDSVVQIARYPIDIYGVFVQKVFVWGLPLAFLAFIPSNQLRQGFDLGMVAMSVVWAVVFVAASRLFWLYALRSYGSASS